MKNSSINRMLRNEAKKLPEEMYVAYPKEFVDMPVFDKEGKDTGKMEEKWIRMPTEYRVNHGRRLWRIWKRTKSIFELQKYFVERGFNLMYK